MKSTLTNMILSLLGITLVASAGVGYVYEITKEPIAIAKQAAIEESLTKVLPEFDRNEKVSLVVDELPIDVYISENQGRPIGYAIQSSSKNGYAGLITLMVGINPQSEIINVSVLSHSETPGLGSNMTIEGNSLISSIKGKSANEIDLRVTKDGGDIDALTGATITSRAYGDAIARALKALEIVKAEKGLDND